MKEAQQIEQMQKVSDSVRVAAKAVEEIAKPVAPVEQVVPAKTPIAVHEQI